MKLSSIGEFGLIERIKTSFSKTLPKEYVGIGDDCSVVPINATEAMLVTTDMLIESRHFLLDKISAFDLGHKSLAVNISDIAAMGGIPENAYLSIGIPSKIEIEWLDDFFRGLNSLATKHNVHLMGGDTTQSPDRLIINITLIGKANIGKIKYRSSAQHGDIICVTGILGDSAGGLKAILNNLPVNTDVEYLIQKHSQPWPHVEEGQWLAEQKAVHAMMDVSDGIESDIQRIMKASDCGADINLDILPISAQLKNVSKAENWSTPELAVCGGEDYCLLFTVDEKEFGNIEQLFLNQFKRNVYPIGSITKNNKQLQFYKNGKPMALKNHGFNHFAD